MAKSSNIIVQGMSGTIGKTLTFKTVNGQLIISAFSKPSSKNLTEAQLNAQLKFKEASVFAKNKMNDPDSKIYYQALADQYQLGSAYTAAVTDYLTPPRIIQVNKENFFKNQGDKLVVRAIDRFAVKEVYATFTDANHEILEEGSFTSTENGLDWAYQLQGNLETATNMTITVMDVPGNRTRMSDQI